MATLASIVTGMENGPEAINNNDQALNNELVATTGKITAATADASYEESNTKNPYYASQGTLGFYRKGGSVSVSGYFKLAKTWFAQTAVISVPAGFRPTRAVQVTVIADKPYLARIDSAGNRLYSTADIATGNYCWIETSYETDDDMPS